MFNPTLFVNPPQDFRGTDFWMLNDTLDDDNIDFQLSEMKKQGIGSFIARTYIGLKSDYPGPGFKKHMRTIVEGARKYGLKVFIQAGYMPEAVLDLPADFALRNLNPMPVAEAVGKGEILTELDGIAYVAVNTNTFLDMMNKDAIAFYLKQSYEDMWADFQADFGGVIQSIWVDEPSYSQNGLPWSKTLVNTFKNKWGYDITLKVPLLYKDIDNFREVRCNYWLTVQELMRTAYFEQVHNWCQAHHILFSGHLMTEDTLSSQLSRAGAVMPYYKYFDIPGIDYLTADMDWRYSPLKQRYPGLGIRPGMYTTPLQCTSAARQAGKEQILAEMYGVSSENLDFRSQRNMFDHFAAFGINHRSVHGIFYSLRGRGKRCYPPHVNYYQPYWNDYKVLTDYCARVSYFITQGQAKRNVLLVHPLSSAACERRAPNSPDGQSGDIVQRDNDLLDLQWQLHSQQVDFDFGDEETIRQWAQTVKIDGEIGFQLGKMTYKVVVLPMLRTISPSTLEILKTFIAAGGQVLVLGGYPELVDGRLAPDIPALLSGSTLVTDARELLDELSKVPRDYSFTCEQDSTPILINYRKDEHYRYFFIFNSDCQEHRTAHLTVQGNNLGTMLSGIDASSSPVERLQTAGGDTEFVFEIPEGSAVMIMTEATEVPAVNEAALQILSPEQKIMLPPSWNVNRQNPNALLLEFASYRKGNGEYSPVYPILAIHDILTAENYIGPLTLRYVFQSAIPIEGTHLALESPMEQTITLNGIQTSSQPDGYFWDKSFETVPLPAIKVGENILEVSRAYRPLAKFKSSITSLFENLPGVELESMWIVGDFAVMSRRMPTKAPCVRMDHRFTLNKEKSTVFAELVDQGYPFYAGTISLTKTFSLPESIVGKRATLRLEGFKACLAKVFVNGDYQGIIAWNPPEIPIVNLKAGVNELRLELTNTIRNLIGPYHRPKGEYGEAWGGYGFPNLPWLGAVDETTRKTIPNWYEHRIPDTNAWTEDYMLVSFGLNDTFIFIHE